MLGGVAATDTALNPGAFNGELSLTAGGSSEDYDFQADLIATDLPTTGVGVMTISGFGSLYNNDPQLISAQHLQALGAAGYTTFYTAGSPDAGQREIDGGTDLGGGYDVHVGLLSQGVLSINQGGTMEIQDALFVGLGQSATGTVTVDGIGSYLTANGRDEFDPTNGQSDATLTFGSIIGGHGQGTLNVISGGQADFRNGLSLGHANTTVSLSGGSSTPSGSGTVIVEGVGSSLRAYASRAIKDVDGTTPIALAVGGMANASTGSGLLRIGDGAQVNVLFDSNYQGTVAAGAKAVIGTAGKIEMQGGQLNVGDALVNDGDLRGYGTVTSGTFYNGSTSSLVVGEGEYLSIRSTGTPTDARNGFDGTTSVKIHTDANGNGVIDGGDADYFQANLGSIRVTGGELELGRTVATDPTAPVQRTVAFQNARYATFDDSNLFAFGAVLTGSGTVVGDTTVGTITGQDATFNFKSGLYNTGVMAFTGGDNTVVGNVLNGSFDYDNANDQTIDPGTPFDPTDDVFNHRLVFDGVILVSGDATTVTFTDNVENEGTISIGPTNSIANFLGDLNNSGTLQVAVDPLGNFARSAAIVVGQNVTINSGSTIIVNFISAAPVAPGFSVALLTAGGALDEASLFSNLVLPDLPDGQFWDVIYDTAADQIRLEIIESLAFGGDFSGDGVVNSADLAIWVANVGILSGASAIQGDADLDGDVDQNDYLVLMNQLFTGVPVLVGGGGGGGPIPEPSTALLALLASAALVSRRR